MTLRKLVASLAALSLSSSLFAGTLSVSDPLELQAFDGKKVKRSDVVQINDNNTHQVVVDASTIVDGSYVELNPIVISFTGSNENIHISTPALNTTSNVNDFKKTLNFNVKTASGKTLPYQADYLRAEGVFPNAQLETNLAKYNQTNSKAAQAQFVNAAVVAPVAAVAPQPSQANNGAAVVVNTSNVTMEDLQYFFKKADKTTQKRFVEWAKKQK